MQRRVKAGEQRHGERWRETKGERKAFYWSVLLVVCLCRVQTDTEEKEDGELEIQEGDVEGQRRKCL